MSKPLNMGMPFDFEAELDESKTIYSKVCTAKMLCYNLNTIQALRGTILSVVLTEATKEPYRISYHIS